jgi:hypothetical protein
MKTMLAALALTLAAAPALADISVPTGQGTRVDRIEDRFDRREGYIDRQSDTGRPDRIEDVVDARETVADRAGHPGLRVVDRHERRSWWRLRN